MINWLPLSHRKGIPQARYVYRDVEWCSGAFFHRTEESCYDERVGLDLKDGDVILLSTHWDNIRPATIAHEFRHLSQHYSLCLPQIGQPVPTQSDGTYETWEKEIRRFFRRQPWEMDALRYELRHAPDETSEEMWLVTMGLKT